MKTTTIDMGKTNGGNVFINAIWKEATKEEISKVLDIISKIRDNEK